MKLKALLFTSLAFIILMYANSCTQTSNDNNFYTYKVKHEVTKLKSAVASAHPLASQAGAWVMKEGGNAFDASIATQLALAVVLPAAGNIGGGGFMIARQQDGKTMMLDFREKAPLQSTKDMYMMDDGTISINKRQGALAVGVPGTIDGIFEILPYAKLPIEKLFEPAIALAKFGFSITEKEANGLNSKQTYFKKYNTDSCPFIKSRPWQTGDTLKQQRLAETLKRIATEGRDAFYKGSLPKQLVKQLHKMGGILTEEDFEKYKSIWRTPIEFQYKNYTMIVPTLPSSGGILLAQMFTMLGNYTQDKTFTKPSIKTVQLMTEIEKRAYADRAKYMGDGDFVKVPLQAMLDKSYINAKIKDFKFGQKSVASKSILLPKLPKESEETTHISIVDKEGNAVSITTTLNGGYGSYVWAENAGFLLNNEMDDFSAKPGTSNMYGAIESEANAIAPEKRMLSSMTPTIVLENDKLKYVVGSPGGTTIPTSVFQTLVNLIDYKTSNKEAVFNPRFHHQYLPDKVMVEAQFPEDITQELSKLGYTIHKRDAWGRVDLIVVEDDNSLSAIGDIRGDDSPDGEK